MTKDDSTWLNLALVAFGAIIYLVFWKAFQTAGLQLGWAERYDQWYPLASKLGSGVAGVAAAAFLYSSSERREYMLAAIGEIRKVNFPTPEDARKMTIIVVVVVGIFAVILSVFDVIWARLLKVLVS
jgi:preprotein translocase SecE subunit